MKNRATKYFLVALSGLSVLFLTLDPLLNIFPDIPLLHEAIAISLACIGAAAISFYITSIRLRFSARANSLLESKHRLERQHSALLELAKSKQLHSGSLDFAFRNLVEIASSTLGVSRCGIWLLDDKKQTLRCLDVFEISDSTHASGAEFDARQLSNYFSNIQHSRVLAVEDLEIDPRTSELLQVVTAGTKSLMDAPIYSNGKLRGLVCIGNDQSRVWKADEQGFAGSLADMAALALEAAERQRAEQALEEQRKFLTTVINSNPNFIFVKDFQGKFTLVNQAVADAYGSTIEAIIGKTDADFNLHPEQVQAFLEIDRQVILSGKELQIPDELITDTKGNIRRLRTVKRPLHLSSTGQTYVLGVAVDITESKKLEEQLFQAHKMEAIGQLAGGVAHDFNNLITAIIGHTHLLRLLHPKDAQICQHSQLIENAADKAAQLTQKLLGFARKGKNQNLPMDLREVVTEAIEILERTVDENIKISTNFSLLDTWTIGDPLQIQQLVLNLGINARDAMTDEKSSSDGGVLSISTRIHTAQDLNKAWGLKAQNYVEIQVSDTGCGIPKELLQKIFEPFFTTKKEGKGTGMGLAMVYGIVKSHSGHVVVESEIGKGTKFRVFLPLIQAPVEPSQLNTKVSPDPISGHGNILLVEDHPDARIAGSAMLSSLGYKVMTAKDGVEAIQFFEVDNGQADLVIFDMIMPRMGARDCIRAVKTIKPGIKTILSTAHGRNHAVQEIMGQGVDAFLQKPYQLTRLSEIVARVLKA